ncbi:thiamine phosphate synthase [Sphingobacterium sp. 1.A.5]|uniref:thiamine phosphate synthase n=1 Tax=Sphingobacterium sp. 1.A.5 TaxID=2044604 RepID=UPI000C0BBEF5|nr:thiamine phosphate synthase [Sphingobacterium sp. 1.A.5]
MPIHPDFPYPLYLVISESDCKHLPWLQVAEAAIQGGVDIIQLREKDISRKEYLQKAIDLKNITDRYAVPLIINDAADIAAEIGSWGIHVGLSDMQPLDIISTYGDRLKIGWSLEFAEQLKDKEMHAVHHLGVSPIFKTPTKTNTVTTWGIDGLEELSKTVSKPMIAIGGMNISNAGKAFESGANSIAVVSAICASTDPRKAAEELKGKII